MFSQNLLLTLVGEKEYIIVIIILQYFAIFSANTNAYLHVHM